MDIEWDYFVFDSIDRWGLDEIETVSCPVCGAENEYEVTDPSQIQRELCGECGAIIEINWRKFQ